MSLALRSRPRTGRAFLPDVILDVAAFDASKQLVIGCKSTAGAPTTRASLDVAGGIGANFTAMNLVRVSIYASQSTGRVTGLVRTYPVTFTHAPGANVKVYAGVQNADALDTDPFDEVSPGVLLAA